MLLVLCLRQHLSGRKQSILVGTIFSHTCYQLFSSRTKDPVGVTNDLVPYMTQHGELRRRAQKMKQ